MGAREVFIFVHASVDRTVEVNLAVAINGGNITVLSLRRTALCQGGETEE